MSERTGGVPDTARIRWSASVRLVPAIYPPVQLFEDTADPADLDIALAVLAITDRGAHDAAGNLGLVPVDERVSGPGSSPVMAAFTHPSPAGSRFADASSGACYAAKTMDTAIAETAYHQARLLALTSSASTDIVLNVYLAGLDVRVHDVRGTRQKRPALYAPSPAAYGSTQAFAATLRATGSNGLAYDSVRHPDGQCVALFRPAAVQLPVRQEGRVIYRWDGPAGLIDQVSVSA